MPPHAHHRGEFLEAGHHELAASSSIERPRKVASAFLDTDYKPRLVELALQPRHLLGELSNLRGLSAIGCCLLRATLDRSQGLELGLPLIPLLKVSHFALAQGRRPNGRSFVAICVYDTHVNSAELIRILKAHGWTLSRTRGSHHQFIKDGRTVTVPHPKKDLGIGLTQAILKQAGIGR